MRALKQASLTIELLSAVAGDGPAELPKEFRLFAKGTIRTQKGTYLCTKKSVASMLSAAKEYGNDFAIDYAHSMLMPWSSADPAQANRAAGWFNIEARQGEVWATNVRWTPTASKMLSDREYRYVSPAFLHSEDGEINKMVNCALTNIPATYGQAPLMASQSPFTAALEKKTMEFHQLVAATLAIAVDSSEQALLDAARAKQRTLTELLSLTGAKSEAEALGTLGGWKAQAARATELEAQIAVDRAASMKSRREALLAQGEVDGKIVPAQRAAFEGMAVEQLEAFLKVAPRAVPAPAKEPKTDDTGVVMTLSADEQLVIKQMGLTEKDYLKAKQSKGGIVPVESKDSKKTDE